MRARELEVIRRKEEREQLRLAKLAEVSGRRGRQRGAESVEGGGREVGEGECGGEGLAAPCQACRSGCAGGSEGESQEIGEPGCKEVKEEAQQLSAELAGMCLGLTGVPGNFVRMGVVAMQYTLR